MNLAVEPSKNATENPLLTQKPGDLQLNTNLKKAKKRSKLTICLIICIVLVAVACLFRFNLVLNADTGLPVSGATVTYEFYNWANGCGKPYSAKTNFLGIVIFPRIMIGICSVTVSADGYHYNGSSRIAPSRLYPRITRLYPRVQNDIQVDFSRVFSTDKGMDIVSYLSNFASAHENIEENNDFIFTGLQSTETMLPSGTRVTSGEAGTAHMVFAGEGGVQAIGDAEPTHSAGEYYFDMENLRTAPQDGYSKELEIQPGKAYVARLRDGKHYMKFHMFASKNFETKIDQVCITAFANPEASPSMDFLDISSTGKFCTRDIDPFTYTTALMDKKIRQDFQGVLTVQKYVFKNSLVDTNGYTYNLNWNSPGADFKAINPAFDFTIQMPSHDEILSLIEAGKATNRIVIPVMLTHNTMVFKATVSVPFPGGETEGYYSTVHSSKELCSYFFKQSDFNIPAVKYNYNECIAYSFGFN